MLAESFFHVDLELLFEIMLGSTVNREQLQ